MSDVSEWLGAEWSQIVRNRAIRRRHDLLAALEHVVFELSCTTVLKPARGSLSIVDRTEIVWVLADVLDSLTTIRDTVNVGVGPRPS